MYLIEFINSLLPRLSKNDVMEDIRVTKAELSSTVIPAASQGATHFKATKIASPLNKDLAMSFYRNYDLAKSSAQPSLISEIALKLPVVAENLNFVEAEIDKLLGADIITDGITVRKAVLIRAADHISYISRFTLDLLSVLYFNEATDIIDDKESQEILEVSPFTVETVKKNIAIYANLLSVYGDKSFVIAKRLDGIPEVVLNKDTAMAVTSTYKATDLDPISGFAPKGFISSPIYHFRMIIAEWQASRYRAMKDKKKMLELRLLHLQLLKEKKADPKIEHEISYIQSRIEKIEYSMSKMES